MFLVEGRKLVEEAIKSDWNVESVLIREDKLEELSLESQFENDTFSISTEGFSQLHSLQQSEGVLAVVHFPTYKQASPPTPEGPGFLLEEIQDPGNMGTLIRTSSWFGFKDIYCSKGCVDAFNPKVLRASMGGIFDVQVHYIDDWKESLHRVSNQIFVAHLEGKDISQVPLPPKGLILIGNEARGVDPSWLNDPEIQRVFIPGAHQAESLNAAVAGSILAWEMFKNGR